MRLIARFKKNFKIQQAYSLMELIAVLVVLAIAIPTLLNLWRDAVRQSVRTEALADASFYGQSLMEEIKSKTFDENESSPWSNSSTFGQADSGETNKDDVDDYHNYTDYCTNGVCRTIPATGVYRRQVIISYTSLSGSTWSDCLGAITCQTVTDCAPCNQCCYKHIKVTVTRPQDGLIGTFTLDAFKAGF